MFIFWVYFYAVNKYLFFLVFLLSMGCANLEQVTSLQDLNKKTQRASAAVALFQSMDKNSIAALIGNDIPENGSIPFAQLSSFTVIACRSQDDESVKIMITNVGANSTGPVLTFDFVRYDDSDGSITRQGKDLKLFYRSSPVVAYDLDGEGTNSIQVNKLADGSLVLKFLNTAKGIIIN